ncbi:MAG: hypothetical protein ACI4QX_08845, partial [Lachnospiraceae bacterium]
KVGTEKETGKKTENPFQVSAGTIEELTEKLKELLARRTADKTDGAEPEQEAAKEQERPHFDMTL